MKLQHPAYANQKLSTEWGPLSVDAEGVIEVKAEQVEFFQKILKFQQIESDSKPSKKVEKAADIAPPKVEVKEEEVPEVLTPPAPEQVEEVSPETEEAEEEHADKPEKKGAKGSRFSGKKGGK